jgi:hypothetical protein
MQGSQVCEKGFVPTIGTTACGGIDGETTAAVGTIAPGIVVDAPGIAVD